MASVSYYKDVLAARFSFSVKYYVVLVLLSGLAFAGVMTAKAAPKIDDFLAEVQTQVLNLYPADLVITSADGTVSVNQPEPYAIALPPEFSKDATLEFGGEEVVIENLIIFDKNGTLDDLTAYRTFMLVNASNVLWLNGNKIESFPVKDLPPGQITKTVVEGWMITVVSWADYITGVVFFGSLTLHFLNYFVFRLVYLAVVALVLLGIGSIRGLKLSFGKYYQVGLHTITLPLVIEFVSNLTGILVPIPFWFLGVNLIFGLIVVLSFDKTPETQKTATPVA